MILCIDVGNSHIYGGVFKNEQCLLTFRMNTQAGTTSDELGVFLKNVLRENEVNPSTIEQIAICSVVPSIDYSLRSACLKYFKQDPFFLKTGVKTGLKIKYHNPHEVGADRIANAIAAVELFPQKNIIIADLGTATVFCAINTEREYLGGAILPGMRLSMEALTKNTAKLSPVEILRPQTLIGRSTTESIQSGLYHAQVGALREFIERIKGSEFKGSSPVIIGTGGFSQLLQEEKIFTTIIADLALQGLRIALAKNNPSINTALESTL